MQEREHSNAPNVATAESDLRFLEETRFLSASNKFKRKTGNNDAQIMLRCTSGATCTFNRTRDLSIRRSRNNSIGNAIDYENRRLANIFTIAYIERTFPAAFHKFNWSLPSRSFDRYITAKDMHCVSLTFICDRRDLYLQLTILHCAKMRRISLSM